MGKTWRYTAGRRGYNLVTVYEPVEGAPLWVELWPEGKRKRQSLRHIQGAPIFDKKLAMKIADQLAAKIERETKGAQLRTILGLPESHTLTELLAAYHKLRGEKWAGSNRSAMEAMRRFWLQRLGPDRDVLTVKGGEVEDIARREAGQREWSKRTEGKHLKYLVTAFNFGRRKLKWYGEAHDLSAVDIPGADGRGLDYTTEEVRALLPALEKVDLRAAVAGHIAYVSLRRITAIRSLETASWRTESVKVGSGLVRVGVIEFAGATDKARRTAQVVLAGRALELAEMLMQTPAVKASGLLFPGGDLHDATPKRRPVRYEILNGWLDEAEKLAGIPDVKGRKWHALKRRAATDAEEAMGNLAAASKQAGTQEATLRRHYLQHDIKGKAALAIRLAEIVAPH